MTWAQPPNDHAIPARHSRLVGVDDVAALFQDGMTVAVGGFINSGHPMALVRRLIRDGRRELTVVGAASAGLEIDLLVAAGVAAKVVTPYVGAEGIAAVGPAFRRSVQSGELEVVDLDEALYYAALRASAQQLPFNPWRAGLGTSLLDLNPSLKVFRDPICGEALIAVPALEIDLCLLHAAVSDPYGNLRHNGTGYGDPALAAASEVTYSTVEQVVPLQATRANPLATTIDGVEGIIRAPFGAHPFSSDGYYRVDEAHLRLYIDAADEWLKTGSRQRLDDYLGRYVYEPTDHIDYLERVGLRQLLSLSEY